MINVNEIRATFLDYFKSNNHEIVASSSLVPRNDPTLMFTNAGMVPFKNVFTGLEKRPYQRATSAQKCVRAGGKHNDLDNVGYTARHHTFFEMLGNFSFGDYFKEQAIYYAWNLLVKEFQLPKEKLLVTIYHTDEVAAQLWKKIAQLPDDKIIRIATQDNFWAMGDIGPCGPCSEIFYDHGDNIWGGPPGSADEDGDRFIEIWNLVFMQYEQVTKQERKDLPHPSIDTGMGLERISAVLQGVHDNYDIDLFRTLIHASEELTNVKAEGQFKASHRVIADHLRSSAFLIADGISPSNEGRGYVLRRIMRRAMRHAQLLGAKEPLMWKLVPTLIHEMGQAYPELMRAEELIRETLKMEETRFRQTLERGLGLLNDASRNLKEGDSLSGDIAFKLYDTYGFPLDLTQDALRQRQIEVDIKGFDEAMAKQRAEARSHWAGSGELQTETIWYSVREKVGATEFLGYETEKLEAIISAIVHQGQMVEKIIEGDEAQIIVNQTSFYAESGGQIGDQGVIIGDNFVFKVQDTQKKADGVYIHSGKAERGLIRVGEVAQLSVDHQRRSKIRINHSATHLLHKALRQVLGNHVAQKGSLVTDERLRFDFSHLKAVSQDELKTIENVVNHMILQNGAVTTRIMDVDTAISNGAMALFGEKYGEEVRVVAMGNDDYSHPWSIELCGGTHVQRTGDIGLLRIISESGVAAGIRRIEALTADHARHYLIHQDDLLHKIAQIWKISTADLLNRSVSLSEERRRLEKEVSLLRRQLAVSGGSDTSKKQEVEVINGISFLGQIVNLVAARDLKSLVDTRKKQINSGVVVLISLDEENKASIVVGVSSDLSETISAVDLVKHASIVLGGKGGGGRPDLAQAGGPDGYKAQDVLNDIKRMIKGKLS